MCPGRKYSLFLLSLLSQNPRLLTAFSFLGEFAYTEAMFVLVRLAQLFPVLKSCDDEPFVEDICLACKSKNGVKVVLRSKVGEGL